MTPDRAPLRPLQLVVPLVFSLSLVMSGAAAAERGDPEKRLVPADQARARALLVRKADLGPGFVAVTRESDADHFYCRALDESDLTVTGEARSPQFGRSGVFVTSESEVYETRADARSSWRRGTSAAGAKCERAAFQEGFARQGAVLESFGKLSFPRLAERSVAFRVVATVRGIRAYLDVIVLQHGRAHAALGLGGLTPLPKAEEVQLARAIAARMATAMRGA
jgi:hypothetical protein